MYRRVATPVNTELLVNFNNVTPLIYLKDEYGGASIIYNDDKCFVLANKVSEYNETNIHKMHFKPVHHWYPEAVLALNSFLTETGIEKSLILKNPKES